MQNFSGQGPEQPDITLKLALLLEGGAGSSGVLSNLNYSVILNSTAQGITSQELPFNLSIQNRFIP